MFLSNVMLKKTRFKFLAGVSFFEITLAFRMALIQVLFAYLSLKLVVESSKNVLIEKSSRTILRDLLLSKSIYFYT